MDESTLPFYPLFLDLSEKLCVVVGCGSVAQRKIAALAKCGARVTVIAPHVGEVPTSVVVHLREFQESDLDGAFFLVAATNDASLNHRIAHLAKARNILVNDVDSAECSSALVPAIFRCGDLLSVAVSTAGASPILARIVRDVIGAVVTPEFGKAAEVLASLRAEWKPTAEEVLTLLKRIREQESY